MFLTNEEISVILKIFLSVSGLLVLAHQSVLDILTDNDTVFFLGRPISLLSIQTSNNVSKEWMRVAGRCLFFPSLLAHLL